MIYLASPYSHPDTEVREERFRAVCRKAAAIAQTGLLVFSPIAHTHPIASTMHLPFGWEYWAALDEWFVSKCSLVAVLQLDGWEESVGIKEELKLAAKYRKQVVYLRPE